MNRRGFFGLLTGALFAKAAPAHYQELTIPKEKLTQVTITTFDAQEVTTFVRQKLIPEIVNATRRNSRGIRSSFINEF